MRCRDVIDRKVVVCDEDATVADCARLMKEHGIGFLPVVDGGDQVSGVVTDRDLALRVLAEGRSADTPVRAVMTRDVRVCHPWDSLRDAERRMAEVRKSRLVVVDEDGHCLGVISLADVAQADTRPLAGHVLYELTRREVPAPRATRP
jgi:CBS domain-containing protein